MAETYYTGPIALKVAKPYGGDLGKSSLNLVPWK
jgi:hypothetical protein